MYKYVHISIPLWGTFQIVTLLSRLKEGQGSWAHTGKGHPHKRLLSSTVDTAEAAKTKDCNLRVFPFYLAEDGQGWGHGAQ